MYLSNPLELLNSSFWVCSGAFILSLLFSPLVIWRMKRRNVNFIQDSCSFYWLMTHLNFVGIWAIFAFISYAVFLLFLVGLRDAVGSLPFMFGSALFIMFGAFSFEFAVYISFQLKKKNKIVP